MYSFYEPIEMLIDPLVFEYHLIEFLVRINSIISKLRYKRTMLKMKFESRNETKQQPKM